MGTAGPCVFYPTYSPSGGGTYGVGMTCRWCFSTGTKMTILKDSKQSEKSVQEIQKDDLVLTFNGSNKLFSKVLEIKKNEGAFEFYVFKLMNGTKMNTKSISVTGNHMMIIFGKDQNDIKLKYAYQLKVGDFLRTSEGLFEIYEIDKRMMNDSYQIKVENGTVLANDILVSTIYSERNCSSKINRKVLDSAKIPIDIKN
jgi:intein/homing endonuclease